MAHAARLASPASPTSTATPPHAPSVHGVPAHAATATCPPATRTRTDCRYCGGALPRGRTVSFCPYCGQDLTVRQCPACSAELDLGWRFCVCCGRGVGEG